MSSALSGFEEWLCMAVRTVLNRHPSSNLMRPLTHGEVMLGRGSQETKQGPHGIVCQCVELDFRSSGKGGEGTGGEGKESC